MMAVKPEVEATKNRQSDVPCQVDVYVMNVTNED
jgi:hypothetical protein